jgi:8-oxo-dGTP pyrophosphatase MutT (NUDIX family)/Fe-S-cluster containining protein
MKSSIRIVDVDRLETWSKYKPGMCDTCAANCCTMPLEVRLPDLVRLGLVDPFEVEHIEPKQIAKRLTKMRLIDHFNPHEIFTMARRASGDCNFLDATTRRCTCTSSARRPAACTPRKAPNRVLRLRQQERPPLRPVGPFQPFRPFVPFRTHQPAPMHHLHIAAACLFNTQGQLLTVRKRGTQAWMLPGGKRDGEETPLQALVRELREELQITMAAADFAPLGQFSAIAANEAATRCTPMCWWHALQQTVQAAAEIAGVQWLALDQPLPDTLAPLLRSQVIRRCGRATRRPERRLWRAAPAARTTPP